MSATVKGAAAIKRNLLKLARKYPGAAGAALYQEGMEVWRESVKRAPVEYGVLRTSAYVAPPTKQGKDVVVEVGFGTEYAIPQHERLDYRHPRGGEAKYLANAMTVARVGMLERLAKRIQSNVEQGIEAPAIGAPSRPKRGGR